jgi:hypothetical protein
MKEDYQQLYKAFKDDTFEQASVSKIVEVVGTEKKLYCPCDLRQGYHHLLLRVEDREWRTFSTGGLTGKMQFCVLLYG